MEFQIVNNITKTKKMDTHVQNDPNNPINWKGKNETCSECEEELTIRDYSTICLECHNKEDDEEIIGSFDKDGNLI